MPKREQAVELVQIGLPILIELVAVTLLCGCGLLFMIIASTPVSA